MKLAEFIADSTRIRGLGSLHPEKGGSHETRHSSSRQNFIAPISLDHLALGIQPGVFKRGESGRHHRRGIVGIPDRLARADDP